MGPRGKSLGIWLAAFVLIAVVAVPLWHPLRVAWRCYALHGSEERERAEVLHKLENATLVLQVVEGSHAGASCTADTSRAIFDATAPGDLLEMVVVPWKPGECELASTIEASGRVLWTLSGVLGGLAVAILGLAALMARSVVRPVQPPRRMHAEPTAVRCPACGKAMDEGALVPLAGIHWRRLGAAIGLPHAFSGLPGTVGWRGRARLHAFRCVPCEVVTFQYGRP